MFAYPIRTVALTLCAAAGLSACTTGPYGYGGVSVGVGNGYYDPYYGGYGYGYGAGYPGYGLGYGLDPYWGWYDGFYYPGTGYYVYDRYRRPHRWTDTQRRYWEQRRERLRNSNRERIVIRDNWGDFANHIDGGHRTQATVQSPSRTFRSTGRSSHVERKRTVQTERSSGRSERSSEARSDDRGHSAGHRRENSRQD